ncbi:MAG TPA: hypothetical protein PK635_02785 [Actinomycetota bacterium]|nr:hypothetical protein [Actinomycetota bacterium]HRV64847.1 hypothetical protein [Candidatus Nanopelagicales bacterium]
MLRDQEQISEELVPDLPSTPPAHEVGGVLIQRDEHAVQCEPRVVISEPFEDVVGAETIVFHHLAYCPHENRIGHGRKATNLYRSHRVLSAVTEDVDIRGSTLEVKGR